MDNNGGGTTMLAVVGVLFALGIALILFILRLIYNAMAGVPEKHRPMTPGQIYLLIIPLFSLYWNFRVFEPMMKGYVDALNEKKLPVNGDGGVGMAKAFAICNLCCLVPFVNFIAAPATLILFILVLIRAYESKKLLA